MASFPEGAPAFARGVRLRLEPDGSAMLLVPEGIVRLNATAAEALALVDGNRSVEAIATELARRRAGVDPGEIAADVHELFERLRGRRLVQ